MDRKFTRRTFLAASAVSTVSLLLPTAIASAALEDEDPILGPGPHNQAYSKQLGNPKLEQGPKADNTDLTSTVRDKEVAVQWAIGIAADDSHGYDQDFRWGPDYDCSSFVIQAFENAGFGVMEAGATYTGNMRSCFLACGFQVLYDFSNLQRGDVFLNEADHTALYIGNEQLVQASINEFGGTRGDDQETRLAKKSI